MYIGDWMQRSAMYTPDTIAVVDLKKEDADPNSGRFTYQHMNDRANRLANYLRGVGVSKDDRVGMLALNGVEYLDIFFACGKVGAIFVPYNWRLHPAEFADVVALTAPSVMVFGSEFAPWVQSLLTDSRIKIAQYLHLEGTGTSSSHSYHEALRMEATAVEEPTIDDSDIICLLFTGGTTGLPKAAQISYRMIAWNTLNTVIHELERGDITIVHTPMFHTGGLLVYTLPILTVGGTVVIMQKWDPDRMLELIEREKITLFFAVPTQFQQLYQSTRFRSTDLSRVRYVTSGGAPLPVPLIRDWSEVHKVPFKQGFGMTEYGPGLFSMGPEFAESKAGSIGRPNYFIDACLVNDANEEVAVGTVGELVLKGPSGFSGYYKDPAATKEVIDAQGFFHTGDLAKRDEDGFFFIVDRKKEMFISGGENVYPAEIEKALYEHPAVHMCAAIGVPDEKWGEVGRAYVVFRPDASASAADLLDFLRERLARYKVPKTVEQVASLPLSGAGKILRRELRAAYLAGISSLIDNGVTNYGPINSGS